MSYLTLTAEKQLTVYEKLCKNLTLSHLEPFPLLRRIKENKAIGLSAPTRKRQEETAACIGWRKYYEGGYFIEVLPTFNEDAGKFSEEGIASVLVKSPSKAKGFKKNLELYFYRQEGMVGKITAIVYFLNKALQNTPRGKDGRLMELKRISETGFYFVSSDGTEKVKLNGSRFFKLLGDGPYKEVVEKIFKSREYYHVTKDPKTASIRQIKKRRKVKKGKNAVPNMD